MLVPSGNPTNAMKGLFVFTAYMSHLPGVNVLTIFFPPVWGMLSDGLGELFILFFKNKENNRKTYYMVITCSRAWINQVRLPILLVVN